MNMRLICFAVAICLLGCGDDSDTTTTGPEGGDNVPATEMMPEGTNEETTPDPETPESEDPAIDPEEIEDPAFEEAATCNTTTPGELCVLVTVPADVPSVPVKVSVHFFSSLPPMGPPTILGAEIAEASELAQFEAGATIPLTIAGLPASGEMFLYGVLYMPGGGAETWQTQAGIDYHGAYNWDEPVQFNGEPINLESPITFEIY